MLVKYQMSSDKIPNCTTRLMDDVTVVKVEKGIVTRVAQLHMVAFQGYPNTQLGLPFAQALIGWFCEAEDAIALCMIDDAQTILGYVFGAALGYEKSLNKVIFWPAVTGILLQPWLILDPRFRNIMVSRLGPMVGGIKNTAINEPKLPGPIYSLVGIGVHPEARRKKIGQTLIRAFEHYAAEYKAKSMRLSVYQDNIAARMLYESEDWQVLPHPNHGTGLMYYYKIISESK